MIELFNIVKKYKNKTVLNFDYFHFEKGKSYLLIGSNGSGKSTLIKCILGISEINQGKIQINCSKVGYVPERIYSPDFLTIRDFLLLTNKLNNVKIDVIDDYIAKFKLNGNLKMSSLSKGMLQKTIIMQAMIINSDLLIFDEPLNGLDNDSQVEFINSINKMVYSGKTIIVATHYPRFYGDNFDYIVKIENGKLEYGSF